MSDTHQCHDLAIRLLGPRARIELRVETDDDGKQWQVAEAYVSAVNGNAPPESRTSRHIARAPYSPQTGNVGAFAALAEVLQAELALKPAEPAPAEEPDAEPSQPPVDDAPAAD